MTAGVVFGAGRPFEATAAPGGSPVGGDEGEGHDAAACTVSGMS
jgi:hypothetical protein